MLVVLVPVFHLLVQAEIDLRDIQELTESVSS